ncbi:MAG: hypothetical protein GF335_01880 [Candidatus Moranbacteria bacterium]|nr:hypothetical protein [Candidatus Moranbacteria bacterium]
MYNNKFENGIGDKSAVPEGSKASKPEKISPMENEQAEKERFKGEVERTQRQIDLAKIYNKVKTGEDLNETERTILANALEGRGWQRMLDRLKPGDYVVCFSSPGNGPHSIKKLNDVFLGPMDTDKVIYDIVQESIKEAVREVATQKGFNAEQIEILDFPFKNKFFKIPKELKGYAGEINNIASEKIGAQEIKLIEEKIKKLTILKDKPGADTADLNEKIQAYEKIKKIFKSQPYQLSFGLAMVKPNQTLSEGDYTEIERAVSKSVHASKFENKGHDGEFDYETAKERIKEAKEILNKYVSNGKNNILIDKDGNRITIFEEKGSLYEINPNILQKIRKDNLEVNRDYEDVKRDLQRLKELVNSLDVIKPYVHEEYKGDKEIPGGGHLRDKVERIQKAVKAIRGYREDGQKMNETEISKEIGKNKEAIMELRNNPKDPDKTSDSEFHYRALEIDQCRYVSLDVLNVGVDLVNGFLRYFQEVDLNGDDETIKEKIDEIIIKDGDDTTKRMRGFRERLAQILEKAGISKEDQIMKIGGDEVILAVDVSKIEADVLLQICEELNTRVTDATVSEKKEEVVVGQADRFNGTHKDKHTKENVKEHLIAMKKAEKGSEVSKEIEALIRDEENNLMQGWFSHQYLTAETGYEKAKKLEEKIKNSKLKIFFVREVEGKFKIFSKNEGEEVKEYEVKDYKEYIREKFQEFKSEIDKLQE